MVATLLCFYGSFLHLNPDPVWATVAHRIVIVLASGCLVLAVLRHLLPPAIAWLCAAWWAVLPIAFNTMYEVHLFALLPSLVVWLLLLTSRGPAQRAVALAVLGGAVVLVRNELSVPFFLMTFVLCFWEILASKKCEVGRRHARIVAASWYVAALSVSALICYVAYERSTAKYPELTSYLKDKHTLNMAQVYAFGYQQRHPEWTYSPWVESQSLMEKTFGSPLPTLREMIVANPRAVWEHFAWNFALTPNGLQVLIFNGASGRENPDYAESALNRTEPFYLSILLVGVWAVGFVIFVRRRREWWAELGSARALGWIAMFVIISVTPLVIATQRPRPSYLFTLAITLIAVTGAFIWLIINRRGIGDRFRQIMPVAMIGLIVAVPGYYRDREKSSSRNTAIAINRLTPFRTEIARPDRSLIASRSEVRRYFHPDGPKKFESLYDIFNSRQGDETLPDTLTRLNIDYFYLDEEGSQILANTYRERRVFDIAVNFAPAGWEAIASDDSLPRWRLFRRASNTEPPVPSGISKVPADLEQPALVTSDVHAGGRMK